MIADLKFKNLRILLNLSIWDSQRIKLARLLATRTAQQVRVFSLSKVCQVCKVSNDFV
ncbi:hypothetical protein NC652_026731 [Populus alba x Populus x berolinensis]|nr:hypothetical protein NC652_026731 [Populus alba x Populus x berolinensis]